MGSCAVNMFPYDSILKRVEFYLNPINKRIYGFTPEQLRLSKEHANEYSLDRDLLSDTIVWDSEKVFIEGRLKQSVNHISLPEGLRK
jgi:hypothetical protein